MRVRDLQQFLESFTASNKSGTRQGNAVSDAVLFVEVNGQLHEITRKQSNYIWSQRQSSISSSCYETSTKN